ncbi:MAG: family 1 glycosylhydrolase [Planctomycetes bacterium]|nr:family 1 glycosylhydrolase [Planctomycetota bacterium]
MEHIDHINADERGDFLAFPPGFLWGAASSPTQIEGETCNEWAGVTARDGNNPDDGSRHWRRYHYDFRLMSTLKLRAYRLGFDWARLQPAPFAPLEREAGLRYMEMLAELRQYRIEPFLTLFHHACPRWFAEAGGWLNPESPRVFADFADKLAALADGEVRHWITINEPNFYAFLAYVAGVFPPWQKNSDRDYQAAVANLLQGHLLAYRAIRRHCPDAAIGVSTVLKQVSPTRAWHPLDRYSAHRVTGVFSHASMRQFLNHEGEPCADFLGINYSGVLRTYNLKALSPLFVDDRTLDKYAAQCDDQWEQNPQALYDGLRTVQAEFALPCYITGHGIATGNEPLRTRLLREHLIACHRALSDGVDLRGYFYWSLLDNFDWMNGLRCSSGLLAVDFTDPDRRREIRRTACVYSEIAARNGLYSVNENRPAATKRYRP